MKKKTLTISLLAVALLIVSLIIKSAVLRHASPQESNVDGRAILTDLPFYTSCQGWDYTVKSLEYSDRLPVGVTRADCSPNSMESWYEENGTIVNEDGSVNEGYFVVNLDIELEDKEGKYIMPIGDRKIMPVNGITLYAFDDKKSTYIHPYYVSKSCYDPVNDADNPIISYSCVDFSEGKVDLTLSYIVGEEIYSEYPEWNLLLNIIGIDINSEKAYNKYVEENGYPPFVILALREKE